MNIYQKNLLTKQIYPLKKINNKWIIEKYYKMNSFFLIEKMNKYSNVINIANCLLDGHKFKITDKGESRYIKFNNNTLYIDSPKNDYIYTIIEGGFGNQLFMIFNIIALSKKYKKKYNIKYDDNYIKNYLKSKNTLRKSSSEYNLFKKIEFNNIDYNNFIKYQEKDYKYNKITLLPKNNYYIKGYFQSYKYFWNNKDEIKEALFIDDNIINEIKNKFKKYNKPILSIHIRLGDYLLDTDFHPIPTIDYYRQALSYYNLDKYQIILFSDNIELAKQKLAEFKLNYIDANTINTNDEYQFYMLCLSNVKICANSSFSLMSCYFNEIYNFIDNAEYIFPHKWFGKKGPNYDVNDLMPNYKFFVINYDNIEEYNKKRYDVVTTLHIKDKDRYNFFLKYNKKYLTNAHRFYYVSYQKYDDLESNFVSESKYQFSKNDVIDYIKDYIPNYRWGWYYQQLLKLYSFRANITSKEFILIFDSDILLLKPLLLFDNDKPILYKRNTGNKKIHTPYKISMEYILPELKGLSNDSGICHLMLFKKDLLEDLLIKIEKYYKKEAWKVCLDSVIYYIKNYNYNESVLSEYELYYAYIKKYKYYKIDTNLKYSDISLNNIDLTDTKYNYIADHHYESRKKDDWMKDNLIEEEIIDIEKLDNIINKYLHIELKYKKYYKENCNIYLKKIFKYLDNRYIFNNFNDDKIYSIIYHEARDITINFRKNIDIIISNINSCIDKSVLLKKNIYIKNIETNIRKKNKFYFGIVIPVYNRYYITKIFLECLKKNINFDSIVFCIVDDGSEERVITEIKNLKEFNYIKIYCNRINNMYSSHNTIIPGSMYPMTLYIGHELLKSRCKILGVLDSDSFICSNYFRICENFTKYLNMNKTILSGFNSYSEAHKIYKKGKINNIPVLYKNMVGGISQLYSTKLYEEFKYKFTGEESVNLWAYDYDYQISNFMNNNNKQYICIENSIVQHIGIKTSMIRNNNKLKNNEKNIIRDVYNILTDISTKDNLKIEFDSDKHLQFNKNIIDPIFNNVWINSFIDKIYYINLDEREDRKEIMEKQFKYFGISNYERISAVKPQFNSKYSNQFINNQIELFLQDEEIVDDLILDIPSKYISDFSKEYIKSKSAENRRKYILGALGCKMSHINILRLAKENNYDNILMIEDDALFHNYFIDYFNKLIENIINIDYDMIWLSPNWLYKNNGEIMNRCQSYKYINDNFAKVNGSLSIDGNYGSTSNNAGNIFSKKCINFILENFENTKQQEMDLWYRNNIQINSKVYTTIPNLIRQRVEESNIEEYKVNYDKDIHYKTRQKFNIFTVVEEKNKEIYLNNLKNNLQKMIGYEKIYYLSDKKLFDNEILYHVNINNLESNLEVLKEKFHEKVTDNNIKYFYYMDVNTYLKDNFFPFDENNNLVIKDTFFCKK